LFRPALRAFCRAYFGLELIGVEQIPASGPLIITPNHQTFADPPLVTIPVLRPVYYMAWSRLFEVPVFGRVIRLLRAFPVQLESADPRATREAVRLLQSGQIVMIFPEGGRSLDGGVQRFKPGAFRLAVSLGTPVLPVTIDGGHALWPPGHALARRAPARRAGARRDQQRAPDSRDAVALDTQAPAAPSILGVSRRGCTVTNRVRVNLANSLELQELPGIGPEQARAIVRFRSEHGPIQDERQFALIVSARSLDAALRERLDFDPAGDTSPEAPGA
jgi:1-acyl-sn-glycerol-3-phosphate acyltransferase